METLNTPKPWCVSVWVVGCDTSNIFGFQGFEGFGLVVLVWSPAVQG